MLDDTCRAKPGDGPSAVANGYATSAAFHLMLEAGRFYLLGVMVQGAHRSKVPAGATPRPTSLGRMLAGFSSTGRAALPDQLVVGASTLGDDLMVRVRTSKP